MFASTTIPVLQETINFAQARHGVLVGNIANLDTPGYRVRDLSVETFQQRLKQLIESRQQRHEPLSPGVLTNDAGDPLQEVRQSLQNILFHDDSDVAMEQQVAEISKNQFLHNLAISVLSSQFQLLQAAVSERV